MKTFAVFFGLILLFAVAAMAQETDLCSLCSDPRTCPAYCLVRNNITETQGPSDSQAESANANQNAANSQITCGNGICDSYESESSCPADCLAGIAASPSGAQGGGNSGLLIAVVAVAVFVIAVIVIYHKHKVEKEGLLLSSIAGK